MTLTLKIDFGLVHKKSDNQYSRYNKAIKLRDTQKLDEIPYLVYIRLNDRMMWFPVKHFVKLIITTPEVPYGKSTR